MQTSLVRYLREKIHAASVGRTVLIVFLICFPIITAIGLLIGDGVETHKAVWLAVGGALLVNGITWLASYLGKLQSRLGKHGLTARQVIGSSGFALLRQEWAEDRASAISVTGTKHDVLMESHRILRAERELRAERAFEFRQYMSARPPLASRIRAALRSSGFSVIRERLPDKDRDHIG